MKGNDERIEKLIEYGLTEYEARAYLALLDLGNATARDIANVSRVPRTKIYSVLDELHAKQLVEIVPERPKRYQAVPFERYLSNFAREYQERLKKIEEDQKTLSRLGSKGLPNGGDRPGSFNVLKGRRNVLGRHYEMVQKASKEILEMGTEKSAVRMAYYLPLLRERAREGVRARIVASLSESNRSTLEEVSSFAEVRILPERSVGSVLLVVDESEVLLAHYVPDDEHLFKGEDVAIWSDDRAIVRDLRSTFLAHWERAEERRRIPIEGSEEAPLPPQIERE